MKFITDIADIAKLLDNNKQIIGLDISKKAIGVAVVDIDIRIISPICTIKRNKLKSDIIQLQNIITTHNIGGFILGYPLNMDGSLGGRCQSIRAFARNLQQNFPNMIISLQDERLSSSEARDFMGNIGINERKYDDNIDKISAMNILSYALPKLI